MMPATVLPAINLPATNLPTCFLVLDSKQYAKQSNNNIKNYGKSCSAELGNVTYILKNFDTKIKNSMSKIKMANSAQFCDYVKWFYIKSLRMDIKL